MEGYPTLSEPELRRLLAEATQPAEDTQVLLAAHTAQLAGHDLRLDGHDAVLATHNARIGGVESSSSNHSGRIAALEEDSVDYGQRLTAAEQSLQSQLTDIQALQANEHATVVTDEVGFAAAIQQDRPILFKGVVNIAGQHNITRPTHLRCLPESAVVFSNPTWWLNLGAPLTMVDCRWFGVSSDQGYALNIGGTQRMGTDATLRISGGCFKTMGSAIVMTGGPSSPLGPRTWIRDVEMEDIGSSSYMGLGLEGAITLAWHLGMTVIEGLRSLNSHGNPIYMAESGEPGVHSLGEPGVIRGCVLKNYVRNGIETFTAASVGITDNKLYGGSGGFTNTAGPGGIGISMAGSNSSCIGNLVESAYEVAIECYTRWNLVMGNTIKTLTSDISDARAAVGLSVDNCFDSLITGNNFLNILHLLHPRYSTRVVNSKRISLIGNNYRNVSYGCLVDTGCEEITFKGNDMIVGTGVGANPSLVNRGYGSLSDVKQFVLLNTLRAGASLPGLTPTQLQEMFYWHNATGGYYDFTSGSIIAGSPGLGFGNVSQNLAT